MGILVSDKGRKDSLLTRLYWFHRRVLSRMFRFFHERNSDRVNAVFIFVYTKIYTFIKLMRVSCRKNKTHRVLAFNRETFEKDLIEVARRTDIDVVFFPMFVYGSFFTAFLPPYMKDQLKYHTYNSYEELRLKDILQDACNKVFTHLKKWLEFEAMISANVDYGYDQAWIEAGKNNRIPFIAICKEGIQSNSHFDYMISHYKNTKLKFKGDKIAVLCERKKEALVLSGVSEDKDVVVTGTARNDSLFDSINFYKKNIKETEKNWIVLFTFKHKFFNTYGLWRDMLRSFARAASGLSSNGNIQFIVKARDSSDKKETEEMLKKCGLLEYVAVKHNISFSDIVKKAVLAVGYNTTAIVEMMATDIPVIVPYWAEAEERLSINMLDTDKITPAYHIAISPDDLINKIEYCILNRAIRKHASDARNERDKIVEKFIYRIDRNRSHVIADMIKQSIGCGI